MPEEEADEDELFQVRTDSLHFQRPKSSYLDTKYNVVEMKGFLQLPGASLSLLLPSWRTKK